MPAINPLRGKVAVDPIFEKSTYEYGSLVLDKPDQYKGRSTQGIVKYIGEDVRGIECGDYVFFSAYTGTLWSVGDELLIILNADGIKAKRNMSEDDRIIPGLYFKGVTDWESKKSDLSLYLHNCIDSGEGIDVDTVIKMCQPKYWQADYAKSINLLAQSIDDAYDLKERNPNNPENFLDS